MAQLGILAILGLLAWGLFFVVMGFSMIPGGMALVMVISFAGGIIDGMRKHRKDKSRRPDLKLEPWERVF